jgi:hypothetical protein
LATNAIWTLVAVLSVALLGSLRLKRSVACRGDRGYKQQEEQKNMNVAVIGAGRVGLVAAAGLDIQSDLYDC